MKDIPSFKEQVETKSRRFIRPFIQFLIERGVYEAFIDGIKRLYTENNARTIGFLDDRPISAYNFIDQAFPWEDTSLDIHEWGYLSDDWRSRFYRLNKKKNRK